MSCYRISRAGETLAIVLHREVARAIVECQPPGHYRVRAIPFDLDENTKPAAEEVKARRPSVKRAGRKAGVSASRKLAIVPAATPRPRPQPRASSGRVASQ
jgi:hypothetical protein